MATSDRTQWRDSDWAAYLRCSVAEVVKYREILSGMFITGIAHSESEGKYRFEMHRYDIAPSGQKRLFLMLSGNNVFDTYEAALKDANTNIIPKMYLNDFWERHLKVPANAVQMMLINER